jgi:hypothetical protein
MKKEYENIGPTEILGHSPHKKFIADLPAYQEKTLIEGGGLKILNDKIEDDEPAPTEVAEEQPATGDEAGVAPGTTAEDPDIKPEASTPSGTEKRGK